MSPEERKEAGIIDLPSTLRNALKALETDEVVRQALGNHIYTNFLDAKRMEWAAMLPLFHNGKLITTWIFIKKLNLKIRLCLVFFFF